MLIEGDLSGLEWRVAAFLSQDSVMLQEIYDNVDPHERVRSDPLLFNGKVERVIAKAFNFRQIYADEKSAAYAYFMDIHMPKLPKKTWEDAVNGFYEKYRGFSEWHKKIFKEVLLNKGMYVCPHTAQRYQFAKVQKGDYNKAQIYNWPVQGMAGGIILPLQLVQLNRFLTREVPEAKIVNTVHDNIVVDAPKKDVDKIISAWYSIFRRLGDSMSQFFKINFNVPLDGKISVGQNWLEMEEVC